MTYTISRNLGGQYVLIGRYWYDLVDDWACERVNAADDDQRYQAAGRNGNAVASTHFAPGSWQQAQALTPFWSDKRSHSYGLNEEQACGREDQPGP